MTRLVKGLEWEQREYARGTICQASLVGLVRLYIDTPFKASAAIQQLIGEDSEKEDEGRRDPKTAYISVSPAGLVSHHPRLTRQSNSVASTGPEDLKRVAEEWAVDVLATALEDQLTETGRTILLDLLGSAIADARPEAHPGPRCAQVENLA